MSEEKNPIVVDGEEIFALEYKSVPGQLISNFADLKNWVARAVEPYKDLEITSETLSKSKKDLARLRKLAEALKGEQKKAKNDALAPYKDWEARYLDATEDLGKAIDFIDEQVKKIIEAERKARAEEIRKKIAAKADDMRKGLKDFVFLPEVWGWFYNESWENSSLSESKRDASIKESLLTISETMDLCAESSYPDLMLDAYKKTGSFFEAKREVEKQVAISNKVNAAEVNTKPSVLTPTTRSEAPAQDIPQSPAPVATQVPASAESDSETYSITVPKIAPPGGDGTEIHIFRMLYGPKYKLKIALAFLKAIGIKVEKPEAKKETA